MRGEGKETWALRQRWLVLFAGFLSGMDLWGAVLSTGALTLDVAAGSACWPGSQRWWYVFVNALLCAFSAVYHLAFCVVGWYVSPRVALCPPRLERLPPLQPGTPTWVGTQLGNLRRGTLVVTLMALWGSLSVLGHVGAGLAPVTCTLPLETLAVLVAVQYLVKALVFLLWLAALVAWRRGSLGGQGEEEERGGRGPTCSLAALACDLCPHTDAPIPFVALEAS